MQRKKSERIKNSKPFCSWILALSLCLIPPVITAAEENASAEAVDESTQEGYTETLEGFSSEVAYCKNGDYNIFGKFYYPEDFDSEKEYPVIIMSHGVSVTHSVYEKGKWVDLVTKQDCVAYAFDFCGSSPRALSDMDMEDMTINTEISDLNAVIDFVMEKDFVDKDHIFLMGQSFGGLISSLTAPDRDNDICGMILLYPALCAVDMVHEQFPEIDDIPKEGGSLFGVEHPGEYFKALHKLDLEGNMKRFTGDVLIIHGEKDPTVPLSYSENAAQNIYKEGQAELLVVKGDSSGHAFELFYEEGRAEAQEKTKEFLTAHMDEYRKVACVGDSITYGIMRGPNGAFTQFDNYPEDLETLLGDGWKVYNYGQPGAYVIRDEGKLSYWNLEQFTDSREKNAEAYIIMLGTNDSSMWNAQAYKESLSALVDAYMESCPQAKIFMMISPTAYVQEGKEEIIGGISGEVLDKEIPEIVKEIAGEKGAEVIDIHSFTADHADWFVDGVHPNGGGYEKIAEYIYENIIEKLG